MSFYQGDDLDKKKADAKLIGRYEEWEIERLPLKYRCTLAQARDAVKHHGSSRAEVDDYLEREYGKR